MKIYGMNMSRSFRAVWAAEEAELDYEYVEVKFGSSEENGTQSDHYRTLQSEGKVPAMEDGSLVLRESGAIVNYLARKSPEKQLLPANGTPEQAHHEEMCFFILTELEQPLWTTGKHKFAIPEAYRVPEVISKTVAFEFAKAQNALLKLKGNNEFAVGSHFTTADILLSHTISWAQKFKFDVVDELLAYRDAMAQRPAFGKAVSRVK